ncbi:MAG: nucleotidyltransferase family protein [Acidimicrobiales bacterium]
MDYLHPVEAVIPGATGRLLAALTRIEVELPISTLAMVAGVGRTRASGIVAELHQLGMVERREVGRTILVALARRSAAGELIDRLGHLRSTVLEQLQTFASAISPPPVMLAVFGSFARGAADARSDVDMLAIRPPDSDPDAWSAAVSYFADRAQQLIGNPVHLIDYDLEELRRRVGVPGESAGANFWSAVRRDAIVLAGIGWEDLLLERHVTPP